MWAGPSIYLNLRQISEEKISPSFIYRFHFPTVGEWGLRKLRPAPKLKVQCKHWGMWGEEMDGCRNRVAEGHRERLDHHFPMHLVPGVSGRRGPVG